MSCTFSFIFNLDEEVYCIMQEKPEILTCEFDSDGSTAGEIQIPVEGINYLEYPVTIVAQRVYLSKAEVVESYDCKLQNGTILENVPLNDLFRYKDFAEREISLRNSNR